VPSGVVLRSPAGRRPGTRGAFPRHWPGAARLCGQPVVANTKMFRYCSEFPPAEGTCVVPASPQSPPAAAQVFGVPPRRVWGRPCAAAACRAAGREAPWACGPAADQAGCSRAGAGRGLSGRKGEHVTDRGHDAAFRPHEGGAGEACAGVGSGFLQGRGVAGVAMPSWRRRRRRGDLSANGTVAPGVARAAVRPPPAPVTGGSRGGEAARPALRSGSRRTDGGRPPRSLSPAGPARTRRCGVLHQRPGRGAPKGHRA
jgi:hypothetical protein